jgi:uncharacterized protein (TIGR03437 family)
MLTRYAILLTVALWAAAPASQAQTAPDAYFQLGFDGVSDTFVIRLTDPARIQTARNILSGTETQLRHVSGMVVKALAFYNVPWTYHFDPNSISFFSFATEVCDSSPRYVQQHLAEVGGALLPGNRWCPWGSKLIREVPRSPAADRSLSIVSAASFAESAIASDSIVSAFGTNFSTTSELAAGSPLPISLAGVLVRVLDSAGVDQNAGLYAVTPNQVNFVLPANTAPGTAVITLLAADARRFSGNTFVQAVAPAVFYSSTSTGNWTAANLLRVRADGTREFGPIVNGAPIDFGPEGDRLFLEIYGTGLRKATDGSLQVSVGDNLPLLYAGPQGGFPGLDQVNVELPRSLAAAGPVNVQVRVESKPGMVVSNTTQLRFARP